MRIRCIPFSVLLLIVSVVPGRADSPEHAQEAAKPTQSTNKQASDTKKDATGYSREPVVYEFIRHQLRYENDGSGTRELHGKVRVQTSAGLETAGQLIFDYNSANETIEIRSIRVEKPDGTVVIAGPENVQDLTAPVARQAPVYSDARQKHVTVPSLAVGDAVEYDVVVSSAPVLPGQFWYNVYFCSNLACPDEQVDLDIPADRKINYVSPESTIEFTTRDAGDRRIYHWKVSAPPAPKAVQANYSRFDIKTVLGGNPPPLPPHIFFSTFQSWSQVGNWYAGLVRDRRVPTPEIRAKAEEIVRGKKSDLEKAEALYSWVSANIRYVSLSFGVGRYQPHSAPEVLVNRYGDCKDKATLLNAFFAAEGLHSNPVLIGTRAKLDADVPSPGQFDHLINYAQIEGKNVWLDSTARVGPFGYLLPSLRGKQALVVTDGSPPRLEKTIDGLPAPSVFRIDVQGEVNKDGLLDATVNLDTRGDLEVLYRSMYSYYSATQFNTFAAMPLNLALSATYGARFTDFVVQDAEDTSKPLRVQFHFLGALSYVDLKSTSREAFLAALNNALLLALLPGDASKLTNAVKVQRASFFYGSLVQEQDAAGEYSMALAIKVSTVKTDDTDKPRSVHFAAAASEYDAASHWDGQTLHASWKLNLDATKKQDAPPEEFSKFCENVAGSLIFGSADATSSASGTTTGYTKESAEKKMQAAHSEQSKNLYTQGRDEAKQKNYANAVETLTSAVKLDPENADAWRELGRSQMYLRNYADAESAFRKYLALAPDEHQAYSNMAWAFYNEKKYTEEVDLLEKRIAAAPDDGDANAQLGAAYLALHQPERALPVLQKAVSISPGRESY